MTDSKSNDQNRLLIFPLGGCGEFGMNTTCYDYKGKLYVVDAGIMFADSRKLGISSVFPDVHAWFEEYGRVEAYLITHGHEDHIGALPFLIRQWPAPIFATPWTCSLIERKFSEHQIKSFEIHTIFCGDKFTDGQFSAQFVHMNHSIPDAAALHIKAGKNSVFHTGDFKIEKKPYDDQMVDYDQLKSFGREGVDLLIADSTNAMVPGWGPDEKDVIPALRSVLKKCQGRIFITTFASNLWRLKTIIDLCNNFRKKLFISGRGMQNTLDLAMKHRLIVNLQSCLISEQELAKIDKDRVVVLTSGSQGEYRSALWRIALGEHRSLKIDKGDTVIFSSRMIPGNEKNVYSLCADLEKKGAIIISPKDQPGIHVSGHAYHDELKKLIELLRPKNYMPVHGSYSQLLANQRIALTKQLSSKNIIEIENGQMISLAHSKVKAFDQYSVDHKYVDQESAGVLSYLDLRKRLRIGELGLVVVSGVMQKKNKKILSPIDIELHGIALSYPNNPQAFIENCKKDIIQIARDLNAIDSSVLNEKIRIKIRKNLFLLSKKKPVVIVKVCLV